MSQKSNVEIVEIFLGNTPICFLDLKLWQVVVLYQSCHLTHALFFLSYVLLWLNIYLSEVSKQLVFRSVSSFLYFFFYNLSVVWCCSNCFGLLNTISLCRTVCLPHRTCRRTRVWGPDCRAPGGLCRSMAACVSCTWAPSTRSQGTWLWVQRLVGSCRAVAIPAHADLKYGDKEASFDRYCRSRRSC